MFNEEFTAASKGAVAKATLLKKNPAGYFMLSVLTLALIDNGGNEAITMGGYWFNLIVVTFGNMIGAILFVALPYHVGSREKKEDCYE